MAHLFHTFTSIRSYWDQSENVTPKLQTFRLLWLGHQEIYPNIQLAWPCVTLKPYETHLICSAPRLKLRASTRISAVNGGLSFLRWRSKWAELERALTPVSVLLETDRDTVLSGFSFPIASWPQIERTLKRWISCGPLSKKKHFWMSSSWTFI